MKKVESLADNLLVVKPELTRIKRKDIYKRLEKEGETNKVVIHPNIPPPSHLQVIRDLRDDHIRYARVVPHPHSLKHPLVNLLLRHRGVLELRPPPPPGEEGLAIGEFNPPPPPAMLRRLVMDEDEGPVWSMMNM